MGSHRPFSAWLLRIAYNLLTDHFRMRRDALSLDDLPNTSDCSNVDLDTQTQRRLSAEAVRAALKYLTEEQQQVIVLRFIEGYNTDEVARFMDKDNGAIRALQHRALVSLQRYFQRVEP